MSVYVPNTLTVILHLTVQELKENVIYLNSKGVFNKRYFVLPIPKLKLK